MGGMGSVYAGHDPELGRAVALKYLKPDLRADRHVRRRFIREAQLLARVSHPRIVEIFDVVDDDEVTFFVQAQLTGYDLDAVLDDRSTLPPDEVLAVVGDLADALAALHGRGLVHRDLKPSNLFVDDERGLCLLDFGLALDPEQTRLTADACVVGTLSFLSPGMVAGDEVGPPSDVFQVGQMAHLLATGELVDRPLMPSWEDLIRIADGTRPTPPAQESLPEPLRSLVDRCCLKDPGERYQDGTALVAALREWRRPSPADTLPEVPHALAHPPRPSPVDDSVEATPLPAQPLRPPRRRWLPLVSLVIVVVVAGLLARSRGAPSPVTIGAVAATPLPGGVRLQWTTSQAVPTLVELSPRNASEWRTHTGQVTTPTTSHTVTVLELNEGQTYLARAVLPGARHSLSQSFTTERATLDDVAVAEGRLSWRCSQSRAAHADIADGAGSVGRRDAELRDGRWTVPWPSTPVADVILTVEWVEGVRRRFPLQSWLEDRLRYLLDESPFARLTLEDAISRFGRGIESDATVLTPGNWHDRALEKERLAALRAAFGVFVGERSVVESMNELALLAPLVFESGMIDERLRRRLYDRVVEVARVYVYAKDFRLAESSNLPRLPSMGSFGQALYPDGRLPVHLVTRRSLLPPEDTPLRLVGTAVLRQPYQWRTTFEITDPSIVTFAAVVLLAPSFVDRALTLRINDAHRFVVFNRPLFDARGRGPHAHVQRLPPSCLRNGSNSMELGVEGPYGREASKGLQVDGVYLVLHPVE